jgi:mono/diheme cytochrome c family protein
MKTWLKWAGATGAAGAVLAVAGYAFILPTIWTPPPPRNFDGIVGNADSGEYLVRAAGCVACHTDIKKKGALFAGGPALKTPFGTFYGPNITPDRETGIGNWSVEDFSTALTAGLSPTSEHYFPAFPFTNYTEVKSQDIADIKAYLETVPPASKPSRGNTLIWPFSDRKLMAGWKWLFFKQGEYEANPERSAEWNRGAYLVRGPTHCGACHTERNAFGARISKRLTGTSSGPNGHPVPGINTGKNHIKGWTIEDITFALQTGLKPDGDVMGGAMGEVVEEGTSHMSDVDLKAIAVYLLSLSKGVSQ